MKIFTCIEGRDTSFITNTEPCIIIYSDALDEVGIWRHLKSLCVITADVFGDEVQEFLSADYYDYVKEMDKIDDLSKLGPV
jgi:hypothetical protein